MEEWRTIPGHEGYEVSSLGRVRSYWRQTKRRGGSGFITEIMPDYQRILTPIINAYGYYVVFHPVKPVHRLVLLAFKGKPVPPNNVSRHLDGNRLNNIETNLMWGTYKNNIEDAILHGTFSRGENHFNAKLNESMVVEIRHLYSCGVHQRELSGLYGVSFQHISRIVRNEVWK